MKTLTEYQSTTVKITLWNIELEGYLRLPENAQGIVIFAHGSGSSRLSSRNKFVADYLYQRKIGTLLFDLLTETEEKEDLFSHKYRFNIPFLSQRLVHVTSWLVHKLHQENIFLPFGFFGASTGAAAALIASVHFPTSVVGAVVSRGGRLDLAQSSLHQVKAPTLLIVGEKDPEVLEFNREAYREIFVDKNFHIVKGATHLFEEPGALEEVAHVAAQWFEKYFCDWLLTNAKLGKRDV